MVRAIARQAVLVGSLAGLLAGPSCTGDVQSKIEVVPPEAPPQPAEPAATAQTQRPDEDQDGITDDEDRCHGEPEDGLEPEPKDGCRAKTVDGDAGPPPDAGGGPSEARRSRAPANGRAS